jgi:hypothetical protein
MRSPENDASAAPGGLGPREHPERTAINPAARIIFKEAYILTGCMDVSAATANRINRRAAASYPSPHFVTMSVA